MHERKVYFVVLDSKDQTPIVPYLLSRYHKHGPVLCRFVQFPKELLQCFAALLPLNGLILLWIQRGITTRFILQIEEGESALSINFRVIFRNSAQ